MPQHQQPPVPLGKQETLGSLGAKLGFRTTIIQCAERPGERYSETPQFRAVILEYVETRATRQTDSGKDAARAA